MLVALKITFILSILLVHHTKLRNLQLISLYGAMAQIVPFFQPLIAWFQAGILQYADEIILRCRDMLAVDQALNSACISAPSTAVSFFNQRSIVGHHVELRNDLNRMIQNVIVAGDYCPDNVAI